MNIARWPMIVAAALLLVPARIAGLTQVMTDPDITRAFAVANGSESARAAFHAASDLINGATIEIFYNAPTVDDRVLPVRIFSEGREQTRVSVDFSRIQ